MFKHNQTALYENTLRIAGVDLAWGERNGDGLCLVSARRLPENATADCRAEVLETAHVFGDTALLDWIETRLPTSQGSSLLLFDAPVVCPNATGSRPVDRLTTSRFGRFHAGPHPANAVRCARPLRLARELEARGGVVGWRLGSAERLLAEVFPHPAMIRLLGLERIVKYKRGPVTARRAEFARLQGLLRECLRTKFAAGEWEETPALADVLAAPWTKPAEDQLDAFVCALIGYWHWRHGERRSEVLGDLETGFILLPAGGGRSEW